MLQEVKDYLQRKSKSLMVRFSSVGSPLPIKLFKLKESWTDFVNDYSKISLSCDLTFKKGIQYLCPLTNQKKWSYISESYAYANCVNFANRLNYKIYKNAYKRYNKRLDMVCVIEGGKKDLRSYSKEDKRLHAHIGVELPTGYTFSEFREILLKCWNDTEWGNRQNQISYLRNRSAYSRYQIKDSLDSVVVEASNMSLSWELTV